MNQQLLLQYLHLQARQSMQSPSNKLFNEQLP